MKTETNWQVETSLLGVSTFIYPLQDAYILESISS